MAEREGFEPPEALASIVFKSRQLIYSYRSLSIVIDTYLPKIRLITPKMQGFQPFLLLFNDYY